MVDGPATDFRCYYCGLLKPAGESSDEHIVPSCIGGNRNVTLTTRVCAGCNKFAGDNVDLPFGRDWFIESARLLAGVVHRGKRPSIFMGELKWSRPERVGVFLLEGGANVFVLDGTDGKRRLAIALNEADAEMIGRVRKFIKDKFSGLPVVNDASPHSAYEDELARSFISLGSSLPVEITVDLTAWHREVAKMALGLACQILGDAYVQSPGAELLRAFLFENDKEKRNLIPLRGHAGIGPETTPSLTKFWHPGGDEHLLALISTGDKVGFAVNLFGKYENLVEVDATGAFHAALSGTALRGVCWVVDPESKTTSGPEPVEQLLVQRAKAGQ